jgi:phage recombination protein Bet
MSDAQRWDERTRKIVFSTVAKDVKSEADKAHFEHLCVTKGLDPLAKEVWCVARGGKPTFMLSIDGFLKLANSTQQLDGLEIEFFDAEGNASEVWLKNAPPAACVARAYRKGCTRPFTASARFAAYNGGSPLWKKLPEVMLSKVATTLALRRGFSDVLSGLHSPEEMDQAGMVPDEVFHAPKGAPAEPKNENVSQVDEAAEHLARGTNGSVVAAVRNGSAVKSAPKKEAVKAEPVAQPEPEIVEDTTPAAAASVEEAALSDRDDLSGTVAALYKKAQLAGVTVRGWNALQTQCGGEVTTPYAVKILKADVLSDSTKVGFLNDGRMTTGEAFPA